MIGNLLVNRKVVLDSKVVRFLILQKSNVVFIIFDLDY